MTSPTTLRRASSRTSAGALLAVLALTVLVFPLGVQLSHHHGPGEITDQRHGGWAYQLPDHHHTTPHFETAEPVWHPVCALCARLLPLAGELVLQPRPGSFLTSSEDTDPSSLAPVAAVFRDPARPRGPPPA